MLHGISTVARPFRIGMFHHLRQQPVTHRKMTTTLPNPKTPTTQGHTKILRRGNLVRVETKAGYFRICSPAGWDGPDYATPSSYNVACLDGRPLTAFPASMILQLSGEELRQAELMMQSQRQAALTSNPALARMLRHLDLTRRMVIHFFGVEAAEARDIGDLTRALVPHYKRTHCWACRTSLDNLQNEICPKCGGILCQCGGCRCNWPFPPQTAYQPHHLASEVKFVANLPHPR